MANPKTIYFSRERTDILLYLISLIGVLTFSFLVFYPQHFLSLYIDDFDQERSVIGKVIDSQNDTRRRSSTSLTWYNVVSDQTLYSEDRLFTGDASYLQLELNGNLVLNLQPNSLILISILNNELNLDISSGEIKIYAKNSPQDVVLVNSSQKKLRIQIQEQSSAIIPKLSDGSLRVIALDSPVPVTIDSDVFVANPDSVVDVDVAGKVKSNKFELSLVSPQYGEKIYFKKGEGIWFNWSITKAKSQLWISQNPTFLNSNENSKKFDSVVKVNARRNSAFWVPIKTQGTYYWKVISDEGESAINVFSAYQMEAPKVLFPLDKDRITFQNRSLLFSWTPAAGSNQYQIEILRRKSGESPYFYETVSGEQKLIKLDADIYKWRIGSVYGDTTLWSEYAVFSAKKDLVANLATKVIAAVPVIAEVEGKELEQAAVHIVIDQPRGALKVDPYYQYQDIGKAKVPLAWIAEEGVFQVEVANTEFFDAPIWQQETSDRFTTLVATEPGNYFWRVRKKLDQNKWSSWVVANFQLVVSPPVVSATYDPVTVFERIEEFESKQSDINLNWNPIPFAATYEVDISLTKNFDSFKTTTIESGTEIKTSAKVGSNYFRVRGLDANQNIITKSSDIVSVFITKKLKLSAPKLIEPIFGVKVVSLNSTSTPVVFKWDPISSQVIYQLQIATDEKFKSILKIYDIRETSKLFYTDLKNTKLFWRVRAIYKEYSSPWSKVHEINVQ